MAITKIIDVQVKSNVKDATIEIQKFNNSLQDSYEKTGSTFSNVDKLEQSTTKLSTSLKDAGISILKNNSTMKFLNDISAGLFGTIKDGVDSFLLFAESTKLNTLYQTIYTAVVGTTTGALKALRIAIATTGIGALVVGLGYLISKMSETTNATEEETKAQALLKLSIDATINSYKDLLAETDRYASAAKLRAEIAGKSTKELLQIDIDASEERRRILKEEEDALFRKQQTQNLSLEDNKKVNDRLIAIGRERNAELDKQEILRLQFDKTIADKKRSDEISAAQKRKEREKAEKEAEKQAAKEKYDREQNFLAERNKAEMASLDEIDAARRQNELNNMSAQEAELAVIEEAYQKKIDAAISFGQSTEELEIAKLNALNDVNLKYQQQSYDQEKANTEAKIKLSEEEAKAKVANAQFAADSLAAISDLIGKDTAAGKALAIAAATVSTYLSAQKAYESQFKPLAIVDSPVRGAIAAGIAVAQGLANVKRIASVKIPGGGGGGGGAVPSGGGTMATPQFNVVGNSGINQLAGVLGNKEQTPVKAYVVPSDVTSGQSLDRNIIRNASLG